jgi:hypothetical protein
MAIKALTLSAVQTVESAQDPAAGTPDATKFTIGALDAFVSSWINDRMLTFTDSDGDAKSAAQVKLHEANIDTVRFGLKSWENYQDAKGNNVEFKTAKRIVLGKPYVVVADECLAVMHQELIAELAYKIKRINEVSAEDAGKSDAA